MYYDRWSPGLRQGDILIDIPFPILPRKQIQVLVPGGLTLSVPQGTQGVTSVDAPLQIVMVLSHDCEFNEGKRLHFTVARVEGVSGKTTKEELDSLRMGNDVQAAAAGDNPIALDTFLLDPLEPHFAHPRRANLAAVTSIPMEHVAAALRQKRAELDQTTRVLLRRKLTYFWGRDTEDIPDEDKRSPDELKKEWEEASAAGS